MATEGQNSCQVSRVFTPLKLLENQKSFNMKGGREKVRVIIFMGPSGKPCVPGAEIALQRKLTVSPSDSPKPWSLPKPTCMSGLSLKPMSERDLTVPMGWLRWKFAQGKGWESKGLLRPQCLKCPYRMKKRLASDSDANVVIQRAFLFESRPRRASFLFQVWNFLWVHAQNRSKCPLLSKQLGTAVLVYSW